MSYMLQTIYDKCVNGDRHTDEELGYGIIMYKQMADNLYKMGPVFRLAAIECNRVYMLLNDFQEARTRK